MFHQRRPHDGIVFLISCYRPFKPSGILKPSLIMDSDKMKMDDNQKHVVDFIDLHTLIETLFHKKWLILAMTAVFFILSMFYITTKSKEYQTSTILLIQSNQFTKGNHGTENHPALRLSMPEESAAAQIALMQSNFILTPLVES